MGSLPSRGFWLLARIQLVVPCHGESSVVADHVTDPRGTSGNAGVVSSSAK